MFKKPEDVAERGKTQLKKKAVNQLKGDLQTQLGHVKESDLSELMGSKSSVVEQCKLMSRSVLYYVDGIPQLLDEGGRNKLMPTLQFLWKFPTSVRCFLIHSQVSSFILNGANLMLPGVATLNGLEDISVGEVVCIRVIDNPLPFAVGRSACSWEGIMTNNRKGKAVDVFHVFGDCLSHMGGAIANNKGPNDGFVLGAKFIKPLEGYSDKDLGEMLIDAESSEDEEAGKGGEDEVAKGVDELSLKEDNNNDDDDDEEEEEEGKSNKKMKRFQLKKEGIEQHSCAAREEATESERKAMDSALWTSLVLLLKHSVKDKALPALINVVWPSLLKIGEYLTSRGVNAGLVVESETVSEDGDATAPPPALTLDLEIKRSHHRSVSALFSYAAKQGLLSLEEQQPGVFAVSAVNRTHISFRQIRMANVDTFRTGLAAMESEAAAMHDGGIANANQGGKAGAKIGQGRIQVIIKNYYTMPRNVRAAFPSLDSSNKHQYLTAADVKGLLTTAIKEGGLAMASDSGSVLVPPEDPMHPLARSIYKRFAVKEAASKPVAAAPVPAPVQQQAVEEDEYPAYDDYEEEEDEQYATGGRVVAGVWCPDKVDGFTLQGAGAGNTPGSSLFLPRASDTTNSNPKKPVSLSSKKATATLAAHAAEIKAAGKSGGGGHGGGGHSGGGGEKKAKKSKSKGDDGTGPGPDEAVCLRKDVLMKGISALLSPAYSVQHAEDAPAKFFSDKPPMVEVEVMQVMGNKKMTHIIGLERYGVDLDDLARKLSKKFAASSSVGANTQQPKLMEIVIQGHLAAEAVEFLVSTYGMPAKLLNVSIKKGVKPKKKN
jgi:predicted RNA-binding protein (TIGR00451 family)